MFVRRIVIRIKKMIHSNTVASGKGRPVMSELSLYLKNESESNSPVDMVMIFKIERPAYINGESCIDNNSGGELIIIIELECYYKCILGAYFVSWMRK